MAILAAHLVAACEVASIETQLRPDSQLMAAVFMVSAGWYPFVITMASLAGPFIFQQIRAARREESANDDQPSKQSGRPLLSFLLLVNAIYILYSLLLQPPPNIFSSLRIPFTTPAPTIRALLLQRTGPMVQALPPEMELLLTKLASFEVRTLYARYACFDASWHSIDVLIASATTSSNGV